MKRTLPLLVFLLCGLLIQPSRAQVGHTAPSAEWLTASADRVVRAAVRDVEFQEAPPLYSFDKPGAWKWATVTLAVQETLKGETGTRVVLTLRSAAEDGTLQRWQAARQPLLWFLQKRSGSQSDFVAPGSAWAPVSGVSGNTWAVELGGPEREGRLPTPIFSMNLTLIRTDARLLEAVRSSSRFQILDPFTGQCGLSVSRALMQETGRSGDANAVTVPVNAQLERLALRWMDDPHDISNRTNGIMALRNFRTPAHEKRLLALLDDPETSRQLDYGPDGKLYYWRRYPVREAAYSVLKAWEVPVPNPPHQEQLEEYLPPAM